MVKLLRIINNIFIHLKLKQMEVYKSSYGELEIEFSNGYITIDISNNNCLIGRSEAEIIGYEYIESIEHDENDLDIFDCQETIEGKEFKMRCE